MSTRPLFTSPQISSEYYTEMAHVHFGLRRLTQSYDETEVIEEFHRVLGQKRLGKKSA